MAAPRVPNKLFALKPAPGTLVLSVQSAFAIWMPARSPIADESHQPKYALAVYPMDFDIVRAVLL